MPADPFVDAARDIIRDSLDELRRAVDGLSADALNWRPAASGSNSIAVLAVHSLSSTRDWLSIAFGMPRPDRDRDSEFLAKAKSPATLLASLDSVAAECLALLDTGGADWAGVSDEAVPNYAGEPATAAWALVHAIEHLREHLGQIWLTRDQWKHADGH